jgi:probable phosphoglycerate mutase
MAMKNIPHINGRLFIARHGETVYNAAKRLQGEHAHTPLTRRGFAQADAMGAALRELLGAKPALTLWASQTGRALQTLAVIAEHLELDWHDAKRDARLNEIGMGQWGGQYYADVIAAQGGDRSKVIDEASSALMPAPDGEHYPAIRERVTAWATEHATGSGDRLVIMHGISSRVLRGALLGLDDIAALNAPLASSLPQGSVTCITQGKEDIVVTGSGVQHA